MRTLKELGDILHRYQDEIFELSAEYEVYYELQRDLSDIASELLVARNTVKHLENNGKT